MNEQLALAKVIDSWQKPIYNFALRWLGNEADAADVTQETFLRAIRDLAQLRSKEKLGSWLFTIARRAILQLQRRKSMKRLDAPPYDQSPTSHEMVSQQELQKGIKEALTGLPENHKEVLILRYYHGLNQRQIGEILDRPRTTIQAQLDKGLELLRGKLGKAHAPMLAAPVLGALEQEQLVEVPQALKDKLQSLAKVPLGVTSSLLSGKGMAACVVAGALLMLAVTTRNTPNAGPEIARLEKLKSQRIQLEQDIARYQKQLAPVKEAAPPGAAKQQASEGLKVSNRELSAAISAELRLQELLERRLKTAEANRKDAALRALIRRYAQVVEKLANGRYEPGPKVDRRTQKIMGSSRYAQLVEPLADSPQQKQKLSAAAITDLLQETSSLSVTLRRSKKASIAAVFELLDNPGEPQRFGLTRVLYKITPSLPAGPLVEELHRYAREFLTACQEEPAIQLGIIQSLRAHLATRDRRAMASFLLTLQQQVPAQKQSLLYQKLALYPYPDTHQAVLAYLKRQELPVPSRLQVLNMITPRDHPRFDRTLVTLFQSSHAKVRQRAFHKARQLKQASPAIQAALFNAFVQEQNRPALVTLQALLIEQGDEVLAEQLQTLQDDPQADLEKRGLAAKIRRNILGRKKK
jgi:RNA polymerase sigma-70 factor, ECF subfamily